MQLLQEQQIETAAKLFADGFFGDPAFAHCLRGHSDGRQWLYQFFYGYLSNCKELLLYTPSDALEGVLCLYRWDSPPEEDFDCPPALEELNRFQILDQYYHRDFAVLDIMAVAPDHRGQGWAGKMIDHFIAYCRRERLTPLTEIFGDQHLQMYLSRGFVIKATAEYHQITTYVLEYPL